jgi:hypothetical protein
MYISYVAENSQTKEQYHGRYNNIQYCTKKWMSEISEGNKLWQLDLVLIQQGSTLGKEQVYERRRATDPVTGKFIRARLRS